MHCLFLSNMCCSAALWSLSSNSSISVTTISAQSEGSFDFKQQISDLNRLNLKDEELSHLLLRPEVSLASSGPCFNSNSVISFQFLVLHLLALLSLSSLEENHLLVASYWFPSSFMVTLFLFHEFWEEKLNTYFEPWIKLCLELDEQITNPLLINPVWFWFSSILFTT